MPETTLNTPSTPNGKRSDAATCSLMRYVSVCSGMEAATIAWEPLGWEAVAFSEIEPFPSAVLAHHWPDTPNLGDMTKYDKWKLRNSPDVLVGGTPCQSFSVAGLRKGLDSLNGQLMLTYVEIAAKWRPKWLVWENVPGCLSSESGADFAAFLGALTGREIDVPQEGWANSGTIEGIGAAYGVAWRVLDAQNFGVAQRRRRVFVIGYLGDWRRAAAVLFEQASLCGNPAPSREKGENVTTDVKNGVGVSHTGTLCARTGRAMSVQDACDSHMIPTTVGTICADSHPGSYTGQDAYTGRLIPTAAPIRDQTNRQTGENVVAIAENIIGRQDHNGGNGNGFTDGGPMYTLNTVSPHAVAFTQNQRDEVREMEVPGALAAEPGAKQQSYVRAGMQVRRLTPTECERLQGFPDEHTLIPWRGKEPADCPDGPRYKACGNSMAVPVIRWIGERILLANV